MGAFSTRKEGFTLVEVLAVLTLLTIISTIALPLVRNSIKNAHIQLLRNKMVAAVLDLQNYVSEREATASDSSISIQSYQSPLLKDSSVLKADIGKIFDEFPRYLSAEIRCEADSNGKFLVVSIGYPGFNESAESQVLYRNITIEEVAYGHWPADNSSEEWNDLAGVLWESFNKKVTILPGGSQLEKTSVTVSSRVFELNPDNNHTAYTLSQLASLKR